MTWRFTLFQSLFYVLNALLSLTQNNILTRVDAIGGIQRARFSLDPIYGLGAFPVQLPKGGRAYGKASIFLPATSCLGAAPLGEDNVVLFGFAQGIAQSREGSA